MTRNKIRWQLPFLVLLIVGTVLILRKQAPFQTDQGLVFGTMYKITYQSDENLKNEIEAELEKVNQSLSPFSKESVITHINQNTDLTADSLFTYVFQLAKQISEETHGAFDITVAPLVNAWGFGFKNATQIDSLTIDSIRQFVGIDKVRMENGKVIKDDPRLMLDCSAIAKGFGVDCVARLFDRKGIKNYMIDIGGELVMKGENAQMNTWRIGINKPIDDSLAVNQELQTILKSAMPEWQLRAITGISTIRTARSTHILSTRVPAIPYSTTFFRRPSLPRTVPLPMPMPLRSWCWDWIRPKRSAMPTRNWMLISSTARTTGRPGYTSPKA